MRSTADRARAASLLLLSAGLAASFAEPYLSLLALVPGALLSLSARRKAAAASARIERDAMAFLKALASSDARPFPRRVAEAASGCAFEADVRRAIDGYRSRSDADGFLGLLGSGSDCLSETAVIIMDALGSGSNVDRQLASLLQRRECEAELRMRHMGSMENSASLVQLGNAVFFPAFAGVCRGIAGMGAPSGAWQLSVPFSIVIISYIAIVSSVQAFFQRPRGRPWDAAALFCIGAAVFNVVGAAGSFIV